MIGAQVVPQFVLTDEEGSYVNIFYISGIKISDDVVTFALSIPINGRNEIHIRNPDRIARIKKWLNPKLAADE